MVVVAIKIVISGEMYAVAPFDANKIPVVLHAATLELQIHEERDNPGSNGALKPMARSLDFVLSDVIVETVE